MMQPGRYYIGDLCYVMDSRWQALCRIFIDRDDRVLEGEFNTDDGLRFATFSTAYGDGHYRASNGARLSVDSGSIGCVRVDDIRPCDCDGVALGTVVEFPEPFRVSTDGRGRLTFGYVTVNTAEDDADDDWEQAND